MPFFTSRVFHDDSLCVQAPQCHCSCRTSLEYFCVLMFKKNPKKRSLLFRLFVRFFVAWWQKSHTKLVSIWICDMMITITQCFQLFSKKFFQSRCFRFRLQVEHFSRQLRRGKNEEIDWLDRSLELLVDALISVADCSSLLNRKCIFSLYGDEMWHFTRNEEWDHPLLRAAMMHASLFHDIADVGKVS